MPIIRDDQNVFVYSGGFSIRRNTNTVTVELSEDEVLALIADLAERAAHGLQVHLVIESDKIYAKDME